MMLDLATLLVASTTASLAVALPVIFVAFRTQWNQGLMVWGVGLLLNALSYPVFGLRAAGWVEFSIIGTNVLTAMTLALHVQAIHAFQQGRVRRLSMRGVWALLTLNIIVAIALVYEDLWRNVLIAIIQSAMACFLLREAWAPGLTERRLTGRWVLVAGAASLCAVLICRAAFMVLASDWDPHFKVPNHIQSATYFAVMAVTLINSIGFVLMQMEWALSKQESLATHDGLTGLLNRTALQDLLPRYAAQSRRYRQPLAFLMLDIDHFKKVNDQHGHLAGDEVLREVARRIRSRMRQSDILIRFGGEEFLAVLPSTDLEGARIVAEGMRQSMESEAVEFGGKAIPVTISAGVHVGIPSDTPKVLDAMMDASDKALYAAKNTGRNRVMLSTDLPQSA